MKMKARYFSNGTLRRLTQEFDAGRKMRIFHLASIGQPLVMKNLCNMDIIHVPNHPTPTDDDLAAIRAKIEMSELAHAILSFHANCATLESVSGLQLLRRAADDLATPLALVAHNDYVRAHATEFGFPVFNSLTQAQNTKWRMGESKRESNPHRQECYLRILLNPNDSRLRRRQSKIGAAR